LAYPFCPYIPNKINKQAEKPGLLAFTECSRQYKYCDRMRVKNTWLFFSTQ
jgi:hypothetical protein